MEQEFVRFSEERYLTKAEMAYRINSENKREIIESINLKRKEKAVCLPLKDSSEKMLWFYINDKIKENILYLEKISVNNAIRFLNKIILSQIEEEGVFSESFTSSLIEGAFSTRKAAEDIIINKKMPVNKSEKMIYNNYEGMQYILNNLDKNIEKEIVLALHKIITKDTMEEEDRTEEYRKDKVFVYNSSNEVIHAAPSFQKIEQMMQDMYSYIAKEKNISPFLVSAIVHFYFVYVHPFFDGNGRTARALTYMYLIKNGFDYFRFFSVSEMIFEDRINYYKAIKDSENEEGDITYFIDYMLEMLVKSIDKMINKYSLEYQKQAIFIYLKKNNIEISSRQKIELEKLFKRKVHEFNIEGYMKSAKVVQETARTDLNDLVDKNILKKIKDGKKFVYRVNEEIKLL